MNFISQLPQNIIDNLNKIPDDNEKTKIIMDMMKQNGIQ